MDYGLIIFATEYSIQPAHLATELEQRGFESLWVPEHTHIPACRTSPWPGGADLPKEYYHTYDPFVALAAAAAVTTRLKLGTGITLIPERDPITLAKEVATLDNISGGRLLLGIGGGWNAEEMANHGVEFGRRWKVVRERIEAMKAIWAEEKAEYHGEFVDFDPIYSWPKPVQKPHPPILYGGGAPAAIRRVTRYCDGWMPIGIRDRIVEELPKFRRAFEEAGRDPDSLQVTVYGTQPDADNLARLRDAGVGRICFFAPSADAETILPMLDSFGDLIAAVERG